MHDQETFAGIDNAVIEKKNNECYEVEVFGDKIQTFMNEDNEKYITIKSVCERIGLAPNKQAKKLQKDPNFNCDLNVAVGKDGKNHEMMCLPLKQLEGWLMTINPNRLGKRVRKTFKEFRKCSIQALYEFWNLGVAIADQEDIGIRNQLFQQLSLDYAILQDKNNEQIKVIGNKDIKIAELKKDNSNMYGANYNRKKDITRLEGTINSFNTEHAKAIELLKAEGQGIINQKKEIIANLEAQPKGKERLDTTELTKMVEMYKLRLDGQSELMVIQKGDIKQLSQIIIDKDGLLRSSEAKNKILDRADKRNLKYIEKQITGRYSEIMNPVV